MNADALRNRILDDEALTGDLDEQDAIVTVEWMLGKVGELAGRAGAAECVDALCRRVRGVGKVHAAIREGDARATAEWAAKAGIVVVADGPDLIQRLLSQLELSIPAKG